MNRRGVSLVEVLIAMVLMSFGLLSLAQAAALGLRVTTRARNDMQYYADEQQIMDSLVARGWNKVTSGATTLRGRPVSWTVTTLTPNAQRITMLVTRPKYQSPTRYATDTLTVYLNNPTIVP
ncbi:MAG TPA: prepilin-type N-terminal cleavage/methylation domain-containing protein [Gemmatimonadales bacterium]|nr:prepilin-type N-terminal cleavage/methylation domain-containing protein [Gemmatimonadales bacterium]